MTFVPSVELDLRGVIPTPPPPQLEPALWSTLRNMTSGELVWLVMAAGDELLVRQQARSS